MKMLAWNVALCAIFTLAILAGAEAYLRLTVPASSEESIFEYTLATKRYKLMKRDARVIAYGSELRTNRIGFRDNGSAVPQKQPGEYRIIVLGDSFTVSAGVDYARIYTTLVGERLKERQPQVRVINLAVSGYNIIQYQLVLEEIGLALQPDMVLVSMFPVNDFELDTYKGNYRSALGLPPAPPRWYEQLYVHQAYLSRVEAALGRLLQGSKAAPAGADDELGWQRNTAALHEIAKIAAREHLPLAVAMLPHTRGFKAQHVIFGRVADYCKAERLRCLNLLELFEAAGIKDDASLRLNPLDPHPNEKYNALVAHFLTPYLSTLLPPRLSAPELQTVRLPQ
jgi:hypothetical protein